VTYIHIHLLLRTDIGTRIERTVGRKSELTSGTRGKREFWSDVEEPYEFGFDEAVGVDVVEDEVGVDALCPNGYRKLGAGWE